MNIKILIPVVIIVIIYVIFFAHDIVMRSHTKFLPKWVWIVICFISVPLGGIVYYIFGRVPDTSRGSNVDE